MTSSSAFFSSFACLGAKSPKSDFSGLENALLPKIEVASTVSFLSAIVSAANLAIEGFMNVSVFNFEFAAVLSSPKTG